MAVLENLKPERVFYYFEEICNIPHGSGNTKQISDYLVEFAKKKELRFIQDEMGNVVIFKEASKGYEESPTVILQGHVDMVCEKTATSQHDFEKDGLKLCVEGDEIYAKDTTLGGDDGIAVAYELAVLEDETLAHPAIEAVFTVDEEIGLLGAEGFDTSVLKGKYLINLDSEAEGYLWSGCAGGLRSYSELPVKRVEGTGLSCKITVDGLLGGHSGSEINKNRSNAILLLARFLHECGSELDLFLYDMKGGQKNNAIPRQADAEILVSAEDAGRLEQMAKVFTSTIQKEYTGSDENIQVHVEVQEESTKQVLHPASQEKVLFFLIHYPNGIRKMCGFIEGLVETSCNVGIVRLMPSTFICETSVRSSVGSEKRALADQIRYLTEFLGGEYDEDGNYPAWEYKKDSVLRPLMTKVYKEMYQKEPVVEVIHAGLECGLFYEKIKGLDCVSIGPDMKDIHTSEERLSISSTKRVYEYLVEVLKRIKK